MDANTTDISVSLLEKLKKSLPDLKPQYPDRYPFPPGDVHAANELIALGFGPGMGTPPPPPANPFALTHISTQTSLPGGLTAEEAAKVTSWEKFGKFHASNPTVPASNASTAPTAPTNAPKYLHSLVPAAPNVLYHGHMPGQPVNVPGPPTNIHQQGPGSAPPASHWASYPHNLAPTPHSYGYQPQPPPYQHPVPTHANFPPQFHTPQAALTGQMPVSPQSQPAPAGGPPPPQQQNNPFYGDMQYPGHLPGQWPYGGTQQ